MDFLKKAYNLHIRISLGSKFQLQQAILILRNKVLKKEILSVKTGKMNITLEFFVFELV